MTPPVSVVEEVPRAKRTFFFTPSAKMKPAARAPTASAVITRLVACADLNCFGISPLPFLAGYRAYFCGTYGGSSLSEPFANIHGGISYLILLTYPSCTVTLIELAPQCCIQMYWKKIVTLCGPGAS